jgi:hypothetical protein
MSNLIATAYLVVTIEATAELQNNIVADAEITSDSPVELPEILIDSLNGGEPNDITYTPINANNLTGISGGTP